MKIITIFLVSTFTFTCCAQVFTNSGTIDGTISLPEQLRVQRGLITQYISGIVGSFGTNDTWSAIGRVIPPSGSVLYGTRYQYDACTLITGIREDANLNERVALLEFGNDLIGSQPNIPLRELKIRYFEDPTNPTSAFDFTRYRCRLRDVLIGYNTTNALDGEARLAVYDGVNAVPFTNPGIFGTAAIYGLSNGTDFASNRFDYSAGVVGDIANSEARVESYGILGIGQPNGRWAGYFIGDVFSSGNFVTSDKKLKKDIVEETSALTKLLRLKPSQYVYD